MNLLLVVFSACLGFASCLNVTIIANGTLNDTIDLVVNKDVEYIIEYTSIVSHFPLRVHVFSENAQKEAPVLVVVRKTKQILSWQLPMDVKGGSEGNEYRESGRTLCYDSGHNDNVTNKVFLHDSSVLFENSPVVSISTYSKINVSVTVQVELEEDFYLQPSKIYNISLTPSEPRYYYYGFPDNGSTSDNTKTVVIEMTSTDSVCMIISIQNATCPVYDLNRDIKFEGYWQTVSQKGGITIPKSKFPNGFFLVFVPKPDDNDCLEIPPSKILPRVKSIEFVIKPSISYSDYVNAIMATFCCVILFYVIFGISFLMCSYKVYIPRTMEYMSDTAANTPTTPATVEDFMDNISFDETEYDTMVEVRFDREIVLSKPVIYLSDLARKDIRILKKKSYTYLWHVLTVALFYGLPVVQLVITYQRVLNDTGNHDLCYYNFLCAHPLGFFSDFNHIFSNIGYILLGFLYICIVYKRERWHKDNNFDQHYGIPQHFGMFYAIGVALIMEGVLSAGYHICPNHSNFQFDTSFMYIIAVLCMVKIYQTRHPDINATAYSTFGVLAVAILLGMLGILEADIYFWSGFTILHILTGFYLTAHIYYMGCFSLDSKLFCRVYQLWRYEFFASPINFLKPLYTGRFVLLLLGNICNWALAVFGLYNHERDFAMHLLAIFMMNTMLYFIFYIIMKLLHKERINYIALCFLVISLTCAVVALYCFINKSISWALTPAQSKMFNQECKLMRFYDFHDIWHFLSAVGMFFMFLMLLLMDDDLSHTHRSKIHVF